MRLLGVDFGGKRIGIAVGESDHKLATPRPALEASGTLKIDANNINAILKREQASEIVLGLPLLIDQDAVGTTDSKMSRIIRQLGGHLEGLGIRVHYVDESMTSVGATQALSNHDWTAATRRKHIDGEAACRILERYMDGDDVL